MAFPIGAKRALPLKRTASPSADDGAPVKGLSEAALYWCTVICSLGKQSDRDRSPEGRDLCSKARFTRARSGIAPNWVEITVPQKLSAPDLIIMHLFPTRPFTEGEFLPDFSITNIGSTLCS